MLTLLALLLAQTATAEPPAVTVTREVAYREADGDELIDRMCRLDVQTPSGADSLPVVVWFHGGGLTAGGRHFPDRSERADAVVMAADYRLSPDVKVVACLDDAAAAVAWAIDHAAEFGGDPELVFVAGHSAGGYLASMVGLDPKWLAAHGHAPDELAGLVPYSGHSITHFTVRKERGIPQERAVVDELAPLWHVRKDAPPMLLITGDRDLELLGRYEETAYFWRMMQVVGHPDCELLELEGFDHGGMAPVSTPLLMRFVARRSREVREQRSAQATP